jgi:hypothetical protein
MEEQGFQQAFGGIAMVHDTFSVALRQDRRSSDGWMMAAIAAFVSGQAVLSAIQSR